MVVIISDLATFSEFVTGPVDPTDLLSERASHCQIRHLIGCQRSVDGQCHLDPLVYVGVTYLLFGHIDESILHSHIITIVPTPIRRKLTNMTPSTIHPFLVGVIL